MGMSRAGESLADWREPERNVHVLDWHERAHEFGPLGDGGTRARYRSQSDGQDSCGSRPGEVTRSLTEKRRRKSSRRLRRPTHSTQSLRRGAEAPSSERGESDQRRACEACFPAPPACDPCNVRTVQRCANGRMARTNRAAWLPAIRQPRRRSV
jgi:hypothetical protein